MSPSEVIIGILVVIGLAIWAAMTPAREDREYPEYWGP